MYVIVKHRVKDQEAFFADIPGVARNAPEGVHPRLFCPSADRQAAVCLWEADAIGPVRDYLDGITEDAAENTYFQVSEEHAVGLPESVTASAS